ncbi:hypothetical protein AX16_008450 [Volvariella volvacea WC 439]|nr:hypothetical protein AX16_008450 [Volvariella volvacea WC 439]
MKTEGTESPASSTATPAPAPTTPATPTTQPAATTSTPTATPAPTYATTSWATSAQIPIDPALQQQSAATHATATHYQHYQYTSHYPQAAYTHYPAYAATLTAAQQQTAQATATAARPAATATSTVAAVPTAAATTGAGGVDTSDIATLNDALGSAGVDLRAEEESLQRTHDHHASYRPYEDRTKKQPPTPNFDTRYLGPTMRTIGTQHSITKIPDESINYLALALRARLQDLVTSMIAASHHRTDTQFDRPASMYEGNASGEGGGAPMWSIVIRSDVAKQLVALEKIEREEEMRVRRERKERLDMAAAHAAALAAQANSANAGVGSVGAGGAAGGDGVFDEDGNAKKKRKKEGPGVTARNMSEDVRKKMSNAVATQAAGLGGRYAWMNAANAAASPAPKPKPAAAAATTTVAAAPAAASTSTTVMTTAPAASTSATTAGAAGATATPATTTTPAVTSSWARPYVPTKKTTQTQASAAAEDDHRITVTMRDAMFVIEKERGHGGGRGAARGWV